MILKIIAAISLFFFSCGRVENSSSQDKALYSPNSGGTPEFQAALAIFSAKCSDCHGSWMGFSEADFVATGLVNPKDTINSKVYYRNQLGPGPSNNMPDGGRPAATTSELETIAAWINSIN